MSIHLTELLALIWLACWVPVVALVHELGHALCAAPAGYRLSSFGLGRGPVVARWTLRDGTVIWLGRWVFAGGACVAVPRMPLVPTRSALFHGGGILAQVGLALALLALPEWWWVEPVARFNLLVAAWNLLPWRLGAVASDGWWLLRGRVLDRGRRRPLPSQRGSVAGLARFEAERGALLGWSSATLTLRWMDLLVGAPPAEDLREIDGLPDGLQALAVVLEAERRRQLGQPMVALRRLLERPPPQDLPGRSPEAEIVRSLEAVVAVRAWLALGDTAAARRWLCRLAGASGPLAAEALCLGLEIALQDGDQQGVLAAAPALADRLDGEEGWAGLDTIAAVQALRAAAAAAERPGWAEVADAAAVRFLGALLSEDRSLASAALAGARGGSLSHEGSG
jgi:hypothetical protein